MLHAKSETEERIREAQLNFFRLPKKNGEDIRSCSGASDEFFSGKNEACPGAESSRKSQPGRKGFSVEDSIDGEKIRLHLATDEKENFGCTLLRTRKKILAAHSSRREIFVLRNSQHDERKLRPSITEKKFFCCIFTRAKRKSEHPKTLFGKYQMVPLRKIKVIRTKKEMVPFKNNKMKWKASLSDKNNDMPGVAFCTRKMSPQNFFL